MLILFFINKIVNIVYYTMLVLMVCLLQKRWMFSTLVDTKSKDTIPLILLKKLKCFSILKTICKNVKWLSFAFIVFQRVLYKIGSVVLVEIYGIF